VLILIILLFQGFFFHSSASKRLCK